MKIFLRLLPALFLIAGVAHAQLLAPVVNFGKPRIGVPPSLDGSANGHASAATTSATFTNTKPNDIILTEIVQNACTGDVMTVADVPGGLTWISRGPPTTGYQQYYAKSSAVLTGDVVTVSCAAGSFISIGVFGVSGANFTSPFDPNGSLPTSSSSGPPPVSTTNNNTFVYSMSRCSNSAPTSGAGFTGILSGVAGSFLTIQYVRETSPQTSLPVTTSGCTSSAGGIGDALTQ